MLKLVNILKNALEVGFGTQNRINKKQFAKYKEKCTNKDETQNNDMGVKGKQYRHYYLAIML